MNPNAKLQAYRANPRYNATRPSDTSNLNGMNADNDKSGAALTMKPNLKPARRN